VKELLDEKDQLIKQNTIMKDRHKSDKSEVAALKTE
jgi:hypothetical protein